MNLVNFILSFKGSARSGHWAHESKPGRRGGSISGGGFSKIGTGDNRITQDTPVSEIRALSSEASKYKWADDFELSRRYSKSELYESGLTSNEIDSVSAYTGAAYREINKTLRGQTSAYDVDHVVKAMDSAMDKAPRINENIQVRRSLSQTAFNKLTKNSEFDDPGFVSTTIRKGGDFQGSGLIAVIRIPKGSKGMYVEPISRNAGEEEILLPRGSSFKVGEVKRVNGEDIVYVDLITED